MEDHSEGEPRYSVERWAIEGRKHLHILKLLEHGVGIRRTAQIIGVGVRTVQRRRALLNRAIESQIEADPEITERFTRVDSMVCPVHGPITVSPCVACGAMQAKAIRIRADQQSHN